MIIINNEYDIKKYNDYCVAYILTKSNTDIIEDIKKQKMPTKFRNKIQFDFARFTKDCNDLCLSLDIDFSKGNYLYAFKTNSNNFEEQMLLKEYMFYLIYNYEMVKQHKLLEEIEKLNDILNKQDLDEKLLYLSKILKTSKKALFFNLGYAENYLLQNKRKNKTDISDKFLIALDLLINNEILKRRLLLI